MIHNRITPAAAVFLALAFSMPQPIWAGVSNSTASGRSSAPMVESLPYPFAGRPENAGDFRPRGIILAQAEGDFGTGDEAERRKTPPRRTGGPNKDDKKAAAARAKLKAELDRMKAQNARPAPTLPAPAIRKPEPQPAVAKETVRLEMAQTVNPELDRLVGRLLLLQFSGSKPADAGVKAIHALLQSGHIAGAVFTGQNIVSKSQLKEVMRFLAPANPHGRPVMAIREFGGNTPSFPIEGGFEPWPSEQAISSKGDPQYAYSVYQTLATNLANEGFNINFGPSIIPAADKKSIDSFGNDPLQVGVFAKTFVLGHLDSGVIPVPILDGSETALTALKTLLVSYPDTPIATAPGDGRGGAQALLQNTALIRGVRFCFVGPTAAAQGENAAQDLKDGCDVLILTANGELPTTVRQRAVQSIAVALGQGKLNVQQLEASAKKFDALRSTFAANPENAFAQPDPQTMDNLRAD